MSFVIFPKGYSVGFAKQTGTLQTPGLAEVPSTNSQAVPTEQSDRTEIHSVKIISDENVQDDGQNFGKESLSNQKTRFHVNHDSNEVVVKVYDDSGNEVRVIPDETHQRLSKGIKEYQNLIVE